MGLPGSLPAARSTARQSSWSTATQDLEAGPCHRGAGSLRFGRSASRDLTGLTPLSLDGAFHMEASYTEGFATIVHDYLASRRPRR